MLLLVKLQLMLTLLLSTVEAVKEDKDMMLGSGYAVTILVDDMDRSITDCFFFSTATTGKEDDISGVTNRDEASTESSRRILTRSV